MIRVLRLIAALAGLVLLIAGVLVLRPVDTGGVAAQVAPAASYEAALARVEVLQRRDTAEINPLCRTRLLSHGHKTARAVILLHGFTNCPKQFELLGEALHARGYNVLIPRQPRHGLADRLTEDLADLTAAELARAADEALDIGAGLGDQVAVAGLSSGGVMTAWLAQTRPEVERAVVIAPAFAFAGSPLLARPVANLVLLLPNQFVWWSEESKANPLAPHHAYPRYATRAIGEVFRLGYAVTDRAERARPQARTIAVVTNAADASIGNARTDEVAGFWRARGAAVTTFTFPAQLQLSHDIIDASPGDPRVTIVYPKIIALLEGQEL